jgi:Uma2 family endonuclease
MDLMDRPKTRQTHREPDPVDLDKDAQAEAEHIFRSIEDEKLRAELIAGEVILNAAPATWHQRVVMRLGHMFIPLCDQKKWDVLPGIDFLLEETEEVFRPDLTIAADLGEDPDSDNGVPARCALLVVEITSASTRKRDLDVKRKSYARNGVPLYMIIDRFVEPALVSLFSEPGERDYRGVQAVDFGPGGGKLDLPQPFDVTLDLAVLPPPPR